VHSRWVILARVSIIFVLTILPFLSDSPQTTLFFLQAESFSNPPSPQVRLKDNESPETSAYFVSPDYHPSISLFWSLSSYFEPHYFPKGYFLFRPDGRDTES